MCEQNLPKNIPPISRVVDVPNRQSSSSPSGSSLFISGDQLGIDNEANVNSGSVAGSEQIDQQVCIIRICCQNNKFNNKKRLIFY